MDVFGNYNTFMNFIPFYERIGEGELLKNGIVSKLLAISKESSEKSWIILKNNFFFYKYQYKNQVYLFT